MFLEKVMWYNANVNVTRKSGMWYNEIIKCYKAKCDDILWGWDYQAFQKETDEILWVWDYQVFQKEAVIRQWGDEIFKLWRSSSVPRGSCYKILWGEIIKCSKRKLWWDIVGMRLLSVPGSCDEILWDEIIKCCKEIWWD